MSRQQDYAFSEAYDLQAGLDDPDAYALSVSMRFTPPLAALAAVLILSGPVGGLLPGLGELAAVVYVLAGVNVWFLMHCVNRVRFNRAAAERADSIAAQLSSELEIAVHGSELTSLREELMNGDDLVLVASREVEPGVRIVVDRDARVYALKAVS